VRAGITAGNIGFKSSSGSNISLSGKADSGTLISAAEHYVKQMT
jgi:hypothetical protein